MLRHDLQVVNIDNNNNISWLTVVFPVLTMQSLKSLKISAAITIEKSWFLIYTSQVTDSSQMYMRSYTICT